MITSNHINIKMLRTVARRLGPLRERVVFLGGCATYLLITDTAIPEIRPTLDVDVIVEIVSRLEYYKLEKKLQELGFAHSHEEGRANACVVFFFQSCHNHGSWFQ